MLSKLSSLYFFIFYINNNFHWATVSSNLHSRHGTIDYYSFHGQIRDYTKIQIFNLFESDNLQWQTNIRFCQQVKNAFDCGIYAVANSFYILSGVDVSDNKTDKKKDESILSSVFRAGWFWTVPWEANEHRYFLFSWKDFHSRGILYM